MASVEYTHPSASPNQPDASKVVVQHKVVAGGGSPATLAKQAKGTVGSGNYSSEQQQK